MILAELLKTLTTKDFLEIGKLQEDDMTKADGLTPEKLAVAFEHFSDMLVKLTVKPMDAVLLALPFTDDGKTCIAAEYFERKDLEEKFNKIRGINMPMYSDNDSEEAYHAIMKETSEFIPQCYGYEFTPWEEVLGATVIPENFDRMGRIEFISCVLGEMSFNGFTRESQEERQKELDEAIKEAEELAKLPKEEREQHAHNINDAFSKFGIERDASWKEERRIMMLSMVKTRDAWIQELKRISNLL